MSRFPTASQLLKIIKTHFITAAIIFIVGMFIFPNIFVSKIFNLIFSIVATVIYFFAMYNSANSIVQRDKKSYTPETPYKYKGLLLPFGLLLVTVFLYLLYCITWKFITINGQLFSFSGFFNNIIFTLWTFPFSAFIDLKNGVMNIFGCILVVILPFVACFLGYLAGYVGYDITATLYRFIYNTDKKENNKK